MAKENRMRQTQSTDFSKTSVSRHGAMTMRLVQASLVIGLLLTALPALAQVGQITGIVRDTQQAVVDGAQVTATNSRTKAKATAITSNAGVYIFPSLSPGIYTLEAESKEFLAIVSAEIKVGAGETVHRDIALALPFFAVTVDASVDNAYRVDTVSPGGPLGTTPILNTPYSVNVISRQLIDDTQSRNFKEAAKHLPLVSFQEMQGPEVLRPESRGMQGSNMQNDRKDGMGIAVTTPSAMEEYEQIEVINGLGAPLYGPANPSGMFNFVTKRPTETPLREIEVDYEGKSVGTVHSDLGGRLGPNKMFGYRTNLLLADGHGYVDGGQLRRQLAAIAVDVRPSFNTIIEGNYSYYNLFQHGYPGWFAYAPSLTASKAILLPVNAPDPTRRGYGQTFSGVDLTSKIGEIRVKHNFSSNWQLVAGVLDQLSNRNINTAVDSLLDNAGNYKSYLANTFSSLAPRFHVYSDLAYLTGRFKTGTISHDVVIGSTGYRFSSYSPAAAFAKTALCTADNVCQASISNPLVFVGPAAGMPSYDNIFVSSVIHQQGFNLGDTITFSRHWLVRLAASQDWTWTDSYSKAFYRSGSYSSNGISPTASLMFKPKDNMTIYGTFADSIQAADAAPASTSTLIYVNASQVLPLYRSTEGEIGYKINLSKINFSTALFRIERPFATGISVPASVCGILTASQTCLEYRIAGNHVSYGIETMLSGRIINRLMLTGGLTVLDPKLNDTGIAQTSGKQFFGKPNYKSNILAEYQLPALSGLFFNFDWQHVGRRPIDDVNSRWTTQYNIFDLGFRYTSEVMGKTITWRITANNLTNVFYWSTIGTTGNTGQNSGSFLGHLGEPRLLTASMRVAL
jgi:iron complex outermembrane recepter protein